MAFGTGAVKAQILKLSVVKNQAPTVNRLPDVGSSNGQMEHVSTY